MNTIILHDSDIREPLFDYLEEKLGKIRILEEKQTGRARADVVMITEKYLFGIEIKSDADMYARYYSKAVCRTFTRENGCNSGNNRKLIDVYGIDERWPDS